MQDDRAKATGNFMAAIPVSFVIGSPIAGWILGYCWFAIKGWRWLFILEGMPAILLGIVAFFYFTSKRCLPNATERNECRSWGLPNNRLQRTVRCAARP
jgi:MFS family permease